MKYQVELTDRAIRDLELLYLEKRAEESQAAARWFNRLERSILGLGTHPFRCPPAPESRKMRRKLRHQLFGKRPHIYRVIYEIDEQSRTVSVLTIRHAGRREAGKSDIG